MMELLYDYIYRLPPHYLRIRGRCRVRIFRRNNGTHTVLLTELNAHSGEGITAACESIATDLVATKRLNPKTTRWIEHEPSYNSRPQRFEEVRFSWDNENSASNPQWHDLDADRVEALTGTSLSALNRRLGDESEERSEDEETEA